MDEPTAPLPGVRLLMLGAGATVKVGPLAAFPPAVTVIDPVIALLGTVAVMLLGVQLETEAATVPPLLANVTVPVGMPKLLPAITMDELMAAVLGV